MPSGDDRYAPSARPNPIASDLLRRQLAPRQALPAAQLGAPASPGLQTHGLRCDDFTNSGDPVSDSPQPARQWTSAFDSRSPLTSPTIALIKGSPWPVALIPSSTVPVTPPTPTTPAGNTTTPRPDWLVSKRSSDEAAFRPELHSSPSKKARTRLVPPGDLDLGNLKHNHIASFASRDHDVTSPLFFSNSARPMSRRHPLNAPTDAAAALLARLRDDVDAVHTVRLPRGNVSSATSPPRSGSTPGSSSWSSVDAAASSKSPDSRSLPPSLQVLSGIGVIELLEQDDRPTFIIDTANPANTTRPGLHILYANASLRASTNVLQLLSADGDEVDSASDFARFKIWATNLEKDPESPDVYLRSFSYGGITWTSSTLRKRFRFVSGDISSVSKSPSSASPLAPEAAVMEQRSQGPTPSRLPGMPMACEPDYFGDVERRRSSSIRAEDGTLMDEDTERHHPDEFTQQVFQAIRPSFDWTRISLTPELNEHIQFARKVDWAATPLGPIAHWGADLRTMANMIMGSPHPAALYWGSDNIIIYNEAYIELAGQKHPKLMGMPYKEAWAEIWDDIAPTLRAAREHGQSTMKNDNQLFIYRHGFLEETFFSWSIVPLVGSDGQVIGLYNPAFENTRRKINERWMLTLREIGEKAAAARDVRGFWPQVRAGLEFNDLDVPFALIYSVRDDLESEVSSIHSNSVTNPPVITLEGTLGVPSGHHCAVPTLDLRVSDEGFAPFMRQSMTAHGGAPIVLSKEFGTLPLDLVEGLEWRGFGDPCHTLVVFPVHPTTVGESVVGFLVLGINPRRPYDDDYRLFIHLLSRQLATSMASVVLFEEEIKRGQRAARLAAMDRQELSMQLYLRTQEAVESEYKFTRMAEFAPVGMFMANGQGLITFANDMWWQISRHPRTEDSVNTWIESVRDEDRDEVERVWRKLIQEKVAITHEFRFKCSKQNGVHNMDTWVLMSAFPEKAEGQLKSVFGCMTDISTQKWAEELQKQRWDEAVELKRQQENFIDITSHEMRNPLSAILQCADEIANSIAEFRESNNDAKDLDAFLEGCLDAANTINLCASHQKRIVDDILTLSKLDSQLLLVTPVLSHPVTIVQHVLKMFESELLTHDIQLEFRIEKGYTDHGINWVKLDPSRLRQVLINLMTNAIKFTQGRETRQIILSLNASRNITEITGTGLTYFPSRRDDLKNLTSDKEWGSGEEFNLHFSVQDTGTGLREEEKKLLFQRFSQASPRTHVQYGGSGLGLFISRILAELQGGQIGVVSTQDVGSTFAFYVKCRKSDVPLAETGTIAALNLARPSKASKPSPASTPPPAPLARRVSYRKQAGGPPALDVLIVEDNLVNQKVLQKQLKNIGNNTHVANHGGEALDTLRKSRYWTGQETNGVDISVILMDLEMPVMDGMTCARRIRQLEKEGTIIRHIPIIAVTAYARPEQIENAKAAGIDDVISKPFRIPELIPKIEELVAKYKPISTTVAAS